MFAVEYLSKTCRCHCLLSLFFSLSLGVMFINLNPRAINESISMQMRRKPGIRSPSEPVVRPKTFRELLWFQSDRLYDEQALSLTIIFPLEFLCAACYNLTLRNETRSWQRNFVNDLNELSLLLGFLDSPCQISKSQIIKTVINQNYLSSDSDLIQTSKISEYNQILIHLFMI